MRPTLFFRCQILSIYLLTYLRERSVDNATQQLKCSGERTGCLRCKALSQDCVYSQHSTRGSGRSRKQKSHVSKSDEDTRTSARPAKTARTPSKAKNPTAPRTSSPQADSLTSVSETSTIEYPMASVQPVDAPNMAFLELDMMPFESSEFLAAQGISTTQMTPCAETWPLSWAEATHEDQLAHYKVPWDGSVNSTAIPLSLQPVESWDAITKYEETPLTPISRQSGFFSDVQTSPLSPAVQGAASHRSSVDHSWLHSQVPEPCQCLQRVTFILEELECGGIDRSGTELGPWLSRHKEAIRCSEALLTCSLCQGKPEYMTILAFLTDRLVGMSEYVVSTYLDALHGDSRRNSAPKDGAWLVLVGSFEVDSPQEWSALVRTMLILQLRDLDALMVQFRRRSDSRRADLTHRKIVALLQKLNPLQGTIPV